MRSRVLFYAALFFDVIAALKIFARRVEFENLRGGLTNPQNLPLAALIVVILVLAFLRRERLTPGALAVLSATGLVFLICSDYIPPVGPFGVKATVLAYFCLILQASTVVVAFSKGRYFGKTVATAIFAVAALTLVGFIFTFSKQEDLNNDGDAGVAVVLGTSVLGIHRPGPVLRGRLDEALDLFKSGMVGKIAVTGGMTSIGVSQANVEAWYLHHNGIPDSDIIIEDKSRNTIEQAIFIRRILVDSLRIKSIAVVTDPWHLPRALLMCRGQDVHAYAAPSDDRLSLLRETIYRFRESGALQLYILFGA